MHLKNCKRRDSEEGREGQRWPDLLGNATRVTRQMNGAVNQEGNQEVSRLSLKSRVSRVTDAGDEQTSRAAMHLESGR